MTSNTVQPLLISNHHTHPKNKKEIGPKKNVLEILKTIKIYQHLEKYRPYGYKKAGKRN
ncbi:hypothetical protein JBL43_19725 [Aureibaculum sp. A20]|uniref:Transposase n=1 Tax=Aureibaculum flavum TaxID=2795986 RepID=A0ABS0WWX2_9FLAO|nr:hypothetical protein [Aureibaculum flavum]MBJ2176489.1 hypothetical protein [Aureibaculum flavum]